MPRKMSKSGLQRLIGSEAIRTQVYDDHNGRTISSYQQAIGGPTIGIGHLIRSDEYERFEPYLGGRKHMSERQVMKLFAEDVKKHTDPWVGKLKRPVTQEMLDAMISLAFNAGVNSYALNNAIAAINIGDYQGASDAIRNGPKTNAATGQVVSGLVRRRNEEADWFLSAGVPTGIRIGTLNVRVLPILFIASSGLLVYALYLKYRQRR